MSKCLTMHYADKRDLGTLEYQMTTLVQGGHTVSEFYQIVYQHLSLILNKLSCIEMSNESLKNMTQSYREKALDTFVRGLKGDLPRLLSIREPADLPQALHLCLKLQNVDYRTQYANNSHQNLQRRQIPLPLPPKKNIAQFPNYRQPFYPQLLNNPNRPQNPFQKFSPRQNTQYRNNVFPQNQYFQKPFANINRPVYKPEPMEVDASIRSRQVNYGNRPQQFQNQQNINQRYPQKRPFLNSSQQAHQPNKLQRVYHMEQNSNELSGSEQEVDEYDEQVEEGTYEQAFDNYVEPSVNPIDSNNFDESEQLDDIYFLD